MTRPKKPIWTTTDDERLRHLILIERVSYGKAAAAIGKSRNACIGRGHRLGIVSPKAVASGRVRGPRKPGKKKLMSGNLTRRLRVKEMIDRATKPVEPPPPPPPDAPKSLDVSLLDRLPIQCAYPYGNGPYTYCGHPVQTDQRRDPPLQYCAFHNAAMHVPVTRKKRERRNSMLPTVFNSY